MPQEGTVDVSSLVRLLDVLEQAMQARSIRHALVGGLAVALYGVARATDDVDVLVDVEAADDIETALGGLGFEIALRGDGFARYARAPFAALPGRKEWIDVLFARHDVGRRLLAQAQRNLCLFLHVELPVIPLEGLLLMKLMTIVGNPDRARDASDMVGLVRANRSSMDRSLIAQEAALLGERYSAAWHRLLEKADRERVPFTSSPL
jgi:hypothetical protein